MLIISSLSLLLVSLPSNSSELLLSSITHCKHRLFIGTFYRPPSSTMAISSLLSLLSNLSSSILSNLILVGDFNVNYVSSSSSPFFLELKSFADSYSLSQVISTPLTSCMLAPPLSLILLLFPQHLLLTTSFFPLFLLRTIMQFSSLYFFHFLFFALTNPPSVAFGSTTKLI